MHRLLIGCWGVGVALKYSQMKVSLKGQSLSNKMIGEVLHTSHERGSSCDILIKYYEAKTLLKNYTGTDVHVNIYKHLFKKRGEFSFHHMLSFGSNVFNQERTFYWFSTIDTGKYIPLNEL